MKTLAMMSREFGTKRDKAMSRFREPDEDLPRVVTVNNPYDGGEFMLALKHKPFKFRGLTPRQAIEAMTNGSCGD